MKILAQRPTHISAVATVLLERERERGRHTDRQTDRLNDNLKEKKVLPFRHYRSSFENVRPSPSAVNVNKHAQEKAGRLRYCFSLKATDNVHIFCFVCSNGVGPLTRQLETSGAWVHQEVVLSRLVVDRGGGGRVRGREGAGVVDNSSDARGK